MRKIEQQMIAAIRGCLSDPGFSGCYWRNANTCVWQQHCGIHGTPSYSRTIEVILHNTVIALIESSRISLYTGGWQTVTTRSRINAILREFCPDWSVCQHRHALWLVDRHDQRHEWSEGRCLTFDSWAPMRASHWSDPAPIGAAC